MSVSLKSSSGASKRSSRSNASKQPSDQKPSKSVSSKSSLESRGSKRQSGASVHSELLPETGFQTLLQRAKARKKPTLDDVKVGSIEKSSLFPTVVTLDSVETLLEEKNEEGSILVTGFGLRNLRSLQDALEADERKRLLELYKRQKPIAEESLEKKEIGSLKHSISTLSSTSTRDTSSKSAGTDTELTTAQSDISGQKLQLQYLMGLQYQAAEENSGAFAHEPKDRDDFVYSNSVSMQQAQRYLRTHRILDFFQFITAHLLSSLPDNPIDFIIELLNKCLLYRSGLGKPPLLYTKEHVSQLFKLMDRMNCGFVEMEQYKQGMMTMGMCEYNKIPRLSPDHMVSKETFIEEALRGEIILFNDLIREKRSRKFVAQDELHKVSVNVSSNDTTGPYFIPSELFKSLKKKPIGQKPTEISLFEEG